MLRFKLSKIFYQVLRVMFPVNLLMLIIFLLVINTLVQVNESQKLITNFVVNGGIKANYVFIFIPGFLLLNLMSLKTAERYLKPYYYERVGYSKLLLFISGVSSLLYSTTAATTIYVTISFAKRISIVEFFSATNMYIVFCWIIIFSWYLFILALLMVELAQIFGKQIIAAIITLCIASIEALSLFLWGRSFLMKQLMMPETAMTYIRGDFMHLILLFGGTTALLIIMLDATISNRDWIIKNES